MKKVIWKTLAITQFIAFTTLLVIYDFRTLGTISGLSLVPACFAGLVLLAFAMIQTYKEEVKGE